MRGKDYNTGLRGVLFEARHYERMGATLWLYGWLVLRQTHQHGGVGWVLGGAAVRYAEIEEETGFNRRTIERWMHTLRRHGYIETNAVRGGVIIRITKAKKFAQVPRKLADAVRKAAGHDPQFCGPSPRKTTENASLAAPIGSSSVEGTIGTISDHFRRIREIQASFPNTLYKTPHRNRTASGSGQKQNRALNPDSHVESGAVAESSSQQGANPFPDERLPYAWHRAQRDAAVRRELNVGSGPEIPVRGGTS